MARRTRFLVGSRLDRRSRYRAPATVAKTASFTVPTAGTYIIQIQYQTKSLAGSATPNPATSTYRFDTNGTFNASVDLTPQP